LDWRSYRNPEQVAEFHRLALPLSRRTYQHKLFDGGLPEDDAFRQRMLDAASRDDVRAYMLWLNGQPVAYAYMEHEQGFLEWAYMGHDHEHANLSPGTVLLTLAIEALQQEGRFQWLDFGSGEGQHKSVFSSQTLPVADVLLLPPTLRNRTLVWLHRHLTWAFGLLRRATQAMGLHSRLKRWVRQKASG
jgi:CelD/BcsL family acetyltransferase involved in cellulose biosynthesis